MIQQDHMGIANIVESSISENSQAFWAKVGNKVPEIPLDTAKYNRGFVNFAMVVGLYATVRGTICGYKYLTKNCKPKKALSGKRFREKYGEGSWAIIADVARNEGYCTYLAKQGINLILMGRDEDIRIASDMVSVQNQSVRVVNYEVDWQARDFNYQEFTEKMKNYDISFLVLPKMQPIGEPEKFGTHNEEVPAFEHFFLLIRHLGPLMQWRSEQSAIILPSTAEVGNIVMGHGVKQGIASALDSFMRCLNYQPQFPLEVISARGSVENCFKALGKQPVSY